MKKFIWVLTVLLFLSYPTTGHALLRKDIAVMKGKVVSINRSTNVITINEYNSAAKTTFTVKKGIDASIAQGSDVAIFYKKGTNIANMVRPAKYK